ncbi:alpha/beta fold hydrolase [Streptomyces sp. NPDC051567]|uniref:alpha/beta fold hydrolase n=1 Tax=Streptomyces sp. NPDC051567 TaxID=3365660 RepID=UPI00378E31BB
MTFPGLADLKSATVDGVSLAYREEGRGAPVVFVHGDLSDLRTWEQQLPAFSPAYRALAYSRRYARPNPDIPAGTPNPMDPHVTDLVAFLHATNAAPAHLVGNSWGAFICLLTAIRHPGVVRSLVLEEPPVVPVYLSDPPRAGELVRLLARPRTLASLVSFGKGTVDRVAEKFKAGQDEEAMALFLHGVLDPWAYERLPAGRFPQMRENLGALKAGLFGAGFPPLGHDEVRSVRAPALVVTGEHSSPVLHRLADRLTELLPHARQTDIPDASHVMHEENAPALNRAVLDFLADLP